MDVTEEQELRAAEILQAIAIQGATVFFEKPLTASDTAGSGRVVIPKVSLQKLSWRAFSRGRSLVFAQTPYTWRAGSPAIRPG